MSKDKKKATKAKSENRKKPAPAKTPAKWGTPDWACEHQWSAMDDRQRKRVVGLLPPCAASLVDELADLRVHMARMFKYLDGGAAEKAGEPEHTLAFAQGVAMDNYECFLRQRVDNAVHDVLRDLWSKKESK